MVEEIGPTEGLDTIPSKSFRDSKFNKFNLRFLSPFSKIAQEKVKKSTTTLIVY